MRFSEHLLSWSTNVPELSLLRANLPRKGSTNAIGTIETSNMSGDFLTRSILVDCRASSFFRATSTRKCRTMSKWLLSLDSVRKRNQQGSFVNMDAAPRRRVIEENKIIDDLRDQSFTIGLARSLIRRTDSFAVTSTILWHARFNGKFEAPMVIRLVNDPGANIGPQQLGVAASKHTNVDEELPRLRRLLKSHPGGNTPLTVHLKDILDSLRDLEPDILEHNPISIVIATDRLPTDAEGIEGQDVNFEFLQTLKEFQDYPVWIERVVDFYSSLDRGIAILRQLRGEADHARLENVRLNILNDLVTEAKVVSKYNPWLTYGLPLHLTRESGIDVSSLYAINERPLDHRELCDFFSLLFARDDTLEGLQSLDDNPLPDPRVDYNGFCDIVRDMTRRSGDLWNPVKKRMMPRINIRELNRMYASGAPVRNATVTATATCSCQLS